MSTAPVNPPLPAGRSLFRKLQIYGTTISGIVGFIKMLMTLPETVRQGEGYLPIIGNFLLQTVEFAIIWVAVVFVATLIVPLFSRNEGIQFIYPLVLGTLISIHLFFTYGFAGALPGVWTDINYVAMGVYHVFVPEPRLMKLP